MIQYTIIPALTEMYAEQVKKATIYTRFRIGMSRQRRWKRRRDRL